MEISLDKGTIVKLAGYGTFTGPLSGADVARLKQIAKQPGMNAVILNHFNVIATAKKAAKKAK